MPEDLGHCINHPARLAVERCEVCGDPLCGFCLYYTSDGLRLCERHARELESAGEVIYTPSHYAEDIPRSQMGTARAANIAADKAATYRGNSTDVLALIALVAAASWVLNLFSCCGALPCVPALVGIMGLAALINAENAVEKRRTRALAGVAILILVLLAGVALLFASRLSVQNVIIFGP